MKFGFYLTMPSAASWNGKWSGSGSLYAREKSFLKKEDINHMKSLVGDHHYRWDDGWCACVEVKQIDQKEANIISRNTKGFCGYDWMIKNIITYGDIRGIQDKETT